MSFLLRNARGASGASRGQQPYRVGPSKSKAPTARPTTSRGGQMQQQLVQRRPAATQQQRTTQSTKQKSQKASQETQDGLQGVISMDEGESSWEQFFYVKSCRKCTGRVEGRSLDNDDRILVFCHIGGLSFTT